MPLPCTRRQKTTQSTYFPTKPLFLPANLKNM
jgi:hypothetical protein